MEKRYYHNFEEDERGSRTFKQIKDAYLKVRTLLKEAGLTIYIAGGSVPYLLLNQESGRLHDDIDSVCRMEDMPKLRQLFRQAGLYNPEWDSMTYAKDGMDYGFEMKVDGVPVGIYPFTYKNGELTQYTYDPYNHHCKIKEFPVQELSDYIVTYTGLDGQSYDAMSLEYIKLSKDKAGRPKDIADSQKISEFGYRHEVIDRIALPKETQNIRAEKLQNKEKSYSGYEFEQFLKLNGYTETMEKLLSKAPSEEIRKKVFEILHNGGCDGFSVNTNMMNRSGIADEANNRLNYASLLINSPSTFDFISQNNISLFHGTNSNALEEILRYGLCSEEEIIESRRKIVTGESSRTAPRKFVSLTDDIDSAIDYASILPRQEAKDNSSFGIIIGVSATDVRESSEIQRVSIDSRVPELGVYRHLDTKYIRTLIVPTIKIDEVNQLLKKYNQTHIKVIPSEEIIQSSIDVEENKYKISKMKRDKDCLLIEGKKESKKEFKESDVKKLAESRLIRGIKRIYTKFKECLKQRERKGIEHGRNEADR